MDFLECVRRGAEKFRKLSRNKLVRIVGNINCDGISGVSIVAKALARDGIRFAASCVNRLDIELLDDLNNEACQMIVFIDFGAGHLNEIEERIHGKNIFILDHHTPQKEKWNDNIEHINPCLFGIDGGREICAAGVAYLFAKELNRKNLDLSYLGIIGAIGDSQEDNGFDGANREILGTAIRLEMMEVKSGFRLYGVNTKPIHKVLEYSTNPYFEGITGNEEGAIKFLESIGINVQKNGKYRMFSDLNDEEKRKFCGSILTGKSSGSDDLFGNVYLVKKEEDDIVTKDAREFSTLLNCCGRLGRASLGIAVCIGDEDAKKEAIMMMDNYRNEIVKNLKWFYKNRNTDRIIEKNNIAIINGGNEIRDTMIGILVSLVSKSNLYGKGTVVAGMANTIDNNIKVSFRFCGMPENGVDLSAFARKVALIVGGRAGGHKLAAGMTLEQDKEKDFIRVVLENYGLVENLA